MLPTTDRLLRPDFDRLITDDCDARLLLNPGRIFVEGDKQRRRLSDRRELLSSTP